MYFVLCAYCNSLRTSLLRNQEQKIREWNSFLWGIMVWVNTWCKSARITLNREKHFNTARESSVEDSSTLLPWYLSHFFTALCLFRHLLSRVVNYRKSNHWWTFYFISKAKSVYILNIQHLSEANSLCIRYSDLPF